MRGDVQTLEVEARPSPFAALFLEDPKLDRVHDLQMKAHAEIERLEQINAPHEQKLRALDRFKRIRATSNRLVAERVRKKAPIQSVKLKWNLRSPIERRRLFELVLKGEKDEMLRDLARIGLNATPIARKGHVVFTADFSKFPALNSYRSPGHIVWRMIFVDERIPENLRPFIIDHEIREDILRGAKYGSLKLKKAVFERGHLEAVRREKRDLERRGLLNEFLAWLKTYNPEVYQDRLQNWKIRPQK